MNRSFLPLVLAGGLALAHAAGASAQDSFGATPAATPAPTPPPAPDMRREVPPTPAPAPQANMFPAPSGPGAAPADGAQAELQDFGVAATGQLKSGGLHGPTPTAIPGGRLVTTPELAALLRDPASGVMVFDVLGGPVHLPNAIPVVPASQAGSFDDAVQRDFGQFLQQATQGRKDRPMVFYCQGVQCWMSYNAALRAIHLGYARVLWYRGGIEAWQQAGGPTVASGMPGG